MKFYHYTSLDHLRQILAERKINLTASNLLKPIAPHIVNGNLVDETDSYKPVAWFTSLLDFDRAIKCGLYPEKTEAAIVFETTEKDRFRKWEEWATENGIEKEWFDNLKQTAPLWRTFYVSEKPVYFDKNTGVIFRPDIQRDFEQSNNSN